MSDHDHVEHAHLHCCCGGERCDPGGVSRRDFLKATGVAFSAAALAGCAYENVRQAAANQRNREGKEHE